MECGNGCGYPPEPNDYLCVICRREEVQQLIECKDYDCDAWTVSYGPQYCYDCRVREEDIEEDFFPPDALVSEHQMKLAPLE
jgi:hypothetical protein